MILLLLACAHHAPAQLLQVADVPPILLAAAGVVDALPDDDAAGCVVTAVGAAALRSAAQAVQGAAEGTAVLPAVAVRVDACGPLPAGVDVPGEVAGVLAVLPLALAPPQAGMDPCAATWTSAALRYLDGLAPTVLAEVEAPDGVIEVAAVAVEGVGCR